MGKTCCGPDEAGANNNDPTWRRILWIALGLNAIMFGVEIVAGIAADSRALQADALDFLGDAANYAISLGVAGMALVWRARAALVKAATMLAFGLSLALKQFGIFLVPLLMLGFAGVMFHSAPAQPDSTAPIK